MSINKGFNAVKNKILYDRSLSDNDKFTASIEVFVSFMTSCSNSIDDYVLARTKISINKDRFSIISTIKEIADLLVDAFVEQKGRCFYSDIMLDLERSSLRTFSVKR